MFTRAYIAIVCPLLSDAPFNGTVTYSPHNNRSFGSQATYSVNCPEGYERNGGDDVRVCTGDGTTNIGEWNGTAPVCSGLE